jgi:hypothetical protein
MNEMTSEQERFAKTLGSFPQEAQMPEPQEKGWLKYYNLYEALRKLGGTFLGYYGRFMYNPISVLRKGNYYLLAINPGFNEARPEDHTFLRDEIRNWGGDGKRAYHAMVQEHWGGHFEASVKALWREIGLDLGELCASNLYFCSSTVEKEMPSLSESDKRACWSVHRAVLEIVEPRCILVFSTAQDKYSMLLDSLMGLRRGKDFGTSACTCKMAVGEYRKRPTMLVGIPYPNYGKQLTRHPDVTAEIAKKCHEFIEANPRNGPDAPHQAS